MKACIVAIQFLTRIQLARVGEVTPEDLGRSVGCFPVAGACIGLLLAGFSLVMAAWLPPGVLACVLILLELVITGGLHCDGLMDTMDGIFSGRSRSRMLEIMKDSRVGAFGVMSFGVFLLMKWSVLAELLPHPAALALFIMPVVGRFAAVMAICLFPYGRPEGLGKVFAEYAGRKRLWVALAWTLLFTVPFGLKPALCLVIAGVFALALARYLQRLLDGLTGDTYGAIIELTEVAVLLTFLAVRQY